MLALLAYPFHFLHKAWLIYHYTSDGRWRTWAGMRNGKERHIAQARTYFGPDRWVLDDGEEVRSRDIDCMLDRSEYGYE